MARGAPDYAVNRVGARAFFGFDCLAEVYVTRIGTGGIDPLSSPPVPANKVWNITHVMLWNGDGVTSVVQLQAVTAWGTYPIESEPNVLQHQGVYLHGNVWIEAGDILRAQFVGTGVGDNLYMSAHGTEIDVEV